VNSSVIRQMKAPVSGAAKQWRIVNRLRYIMMREGNIAIGKKVSMYRPNIAVSARVSYTVEVDLNITLTTKIAPMHSRAYQQNIARLGLT